MFRTLARLLNDPTLSLPAIQPSPLVFQIHPYQLSQWLEATWGWSQTAGTVLGSGFPVNQNPYLGDSRIVGALELPQAPDPVLTLDFLRSGIPATYPPSQPPVPPVITPTFTGPGVPAPGQNIAVPVGLPWEHAAYALIIESTGVYEILAEVTRRYVVGETLEPPSLETQQWIRATEELFFRDAPLFHIVGTTSQFRPDHRVTRRNLYWRMLGMDLPHAYRGAGDQPWKRDVGVANTRFHELWLELLRQVWIGYENVTNSSGAKPTDPAYIAELCRYIKDMLIMRRLNGQLAREEFVAVSQLSWFHLTVEVDTPLVVDLRAQGSNPYERLVKIGERVGMKPSPRSWELFQVADLVSTVLRFIELESFDTSAAAQTLYTGSTSLQRDMIRIIDLWEMATGQSIKDQVRAPGRDPARPAVAPPRRAQPARPLTAGSNGHRPVTGSLVR
jgi:hypothetical protein